MLSPVVTGTERSGAVGMRMALAVCVCSMVLLLAVASAAAARPVAGRLDPSFAQKGWTEVPLGTVGEEASVELSTTQGGATVVAEPYDGRIVRPRYLLGP